MIANSKTLKKGDVLGGTGESKFAWILESRKRDRETILIRSFDESIYDMQDCDEDQLAYLFPRNTWLPSYVKNVFFKGNYK